MSKIYALNKFLVGISTILLLASCGSANGTPDTLLLHHQNPTHSSKIHQKSATINGK